MAKLIKLNMEDFSSESDFDAAVAAMSAALPAGVSATPASKLTGPNGQIVAAIVAMPNNLTAQQHHDVRNAAINANPGVSKAQPLPIGGGIQDFEGLGSPGSTVANPLPVGESPLTLDATVYAPAADTVWKISPDGKGSGGTGSAMMATDVNPLGTYSSGLNEYVHFNRGSISLSGGANGFPTFKGLSISSKFNFADDGVADNAGPYKHGELLQCHINGPSGTIELSVNRDSSATFYNVNINWYLESGSQELQDSISTTIPYVEDQYEDVSLSVDSAGNIVGKFGSFEHTFSSIPGVDYSSATISFHVSDRWADNDPKTQQQPLIDDLVVIIKEA